MKEHAWKDEYRVTMIELHQDRGFKSAVFSHVQHILE